MEAGDGAVYLEKRFLWGQRTLQETAHTLLEREAYMDFNGRQYTWDEEQWQRKTGRAEEINMEDFLPFSKIEMILMRGREDQLQLILREGRRRLRDRTEGFEPGQMKREMMHFCYMLEERIKTEEAGKMLERLSEQEQVLSDLRSSSTLTQAGLIWRHICSRFSAFSRRKPRCPPISVWHPLIWRRTICRNCLCRK